MAKVIIKSEKITPFGGNYYASRAFYALSLDKVINGTLGVRSSTYNGYQWGEVMSAMSDVFLRGGDCYRADMSMRTMKIQIFYGNTLSANLSKSKKKQFVCNKTQTLSLV
ncbi:hypothetical protein [uncultured Prevotella sp.]|uniref:hypothetical protein n=1 Tax=uncultured Prevotella sp. TaxID=159272 RepID=UPI00261BB16B|nr:hypothetical protein [uncultured Prevotella sp.]